MQRPQTLSLLADLRWRPLFEAARPVVPPPLIHKFVDMTSGSDAGTGTFDNPWKTPYAKTIQARPGDYWHFKGRGTPDDCSVYPLTGGTHQDWITFGDWDGAPLTFVGPTGPQPVVLVDSKEHICIERLTIDATNSTTMDGGCIRGNGVGCTHIVVRKNKIEVHGGGYGVQFFADPSHVWVEDNDIDGHGRDDVRMANSGDGVSFGGTGVAHHCWSYRNRIRDFGHIGIQSLTMVADQHNYAICSGFNRINSTLAGGLGYLRCDDSLDVGNLFDGIATNPDSQSYSKEAIIVNGFRNLHTLNRITNVHGPAIMFLMSAFGSVGQSCVDNDVVQNAIYGCPTFPLAITLRSNSPDRGGVLTMAGNRYRRNLHARNMQNGTGGFWEDRIYQIWVALGAAGYHVTPEELERWCPGGVANTEARRLAGITLTDNVFDPVGTSPRAGFLMYNASDPTIANVNTMYKTAHDAAEQFGKSVVSGNVEDERGMTETDPTDPRFLMGADALEALAMTLEPV